MGVSEQHHAVDSTVSLEQRNGSFSKGDESIIAHGWDKMEIPVKRRKNEFIDCH